MYTRDNWRAHFEVPAVRASHDPGGSENDRAEERCGTLGVTVAGTRSELILLPQLAAWRVIEK